jgi:predicted nucleotidyltransferase
MSVTDLARELGTTDRTLRRLAALGTVRSGHRRGRPARAVLQEESYLKDHWALLSQLRAALRTEPSVVAAVLFGSVAAGTDSPESDVDLAVAIDGDHDLTDLHQLRVRLSTKVGRRIDLFDLDDLMAEPELLASVLDEGRPVVDRAYVWARLRGARRALLRRRAGGRERRRLLSRGVLA